MAFFGSKKSWQGQEATGLPPPPAGGAPSGLRSTRISMATPAWHEPKVKVEKSQQDQEVTER